MKLHRRRHIHSYVTLQYATKQFAGTTCTLPASSQVSAEASKVTLQLKAKAVSNSSSDNALSSDAIEPKEIHRNTRNTSLPCCQDLVLGETSKVTLQLKAKTTSISSSGNSSPSEAIEPKEIHQNTRNTSLTCCQ